MSTPRDHGARLRKPRAAELVADRLRHHQHGRRRRVEAAHEGVAPGERHADAGAHIFGKARVIGGGEGNAARAGRRRAPPSPAVPRSRDGSRRARTASACGRAAPRGTATGGSRDRSGRAGCGSGRARTPRPRGPAARSSCDTVSMVRTTPLICGRQASVTMAMRNRVYSAASCAGVRRGSTDWRRACSSAQCDDSQPAVEILDQRRAALDPVAVVAVEHAVDGRGSRRGGCGRRPRRRRRAGAPRSATACS